MAQSSFDPEHRETLPSLASLISTGSILDSRSSHQPLDNSRKQIRILRLYRGFWTDPIRCDTFVVNLSDKPAYTALSYVWGTESTRRQITLNGGPFPVTPNLFAALRRLRSVDLERDLWADAICINQSDNAEKSHQVQLMRPIFAKATEAIMWLGDYEETSLLSRIQQPWPAISSINQVIPWMCAVQAFGYIQSLLEDTHLGATIDRLDHAEAQSIMSSLTLVMSLPWWTRIWTAQEVALPEKVIFQCGHLLLPLDNLSAHEVVWKHMFKIKCCQEKLDRYPDHEFMSDRIWEILLLQSDRNTSIRDFLYILNSCCTRQASDKRDKVYALLGFYPPDLTLPSVDYSLTDEAVCRKALLELIHASGNLIALIRCNETNRSPNLPTWVPHWCAQLDEMRIMPRNLHGYDQYQADKGESIEMIEVPWTTLSLVGQFVDIIAKSTALVPMDSNLEPLLEELFLSGEGCPVHLDGSYYTAASQKIIKEYGRVACSLFITEKGLLGASQSEISAGDTVHILYGGNVPFILRPASRGVHHPVYTNVTDCYVHGIMHGEAVNENSEGERIFLI